MEPIECPKCHKTFYYPEEEKQTAKVCWWCAHGIKIMTSPTLPKDAVMLVRDG